MLGVVYYAQTAAEFNSRGCSDEGMVREAGSSAPVSKRGSLSSEADGIREQHLANRLGTLARDGHVNALSFIPDRNAHK